MHKPTITFSVIITLMLLGLWLLLPSTTHTPRSSSLQRSIENFASDTSLASASWGFEARNLQTGQTLASVNPNLALIPASTQKVVTTLTALALLGEDFRFATRLQYDGKIENGILKGNLYIHGMGDPALGATQLHDSLAIERTFEAWLAALHHAGIRSVEGHIIADGSAFDAHMVPPKWMWEDLGNYYGAGAHALTVYENMYTVFFQPGNREGAPATVLRTEPVIEGMEWVNEVTTGPRGSGDRVYIYGAPGYNQRWFTGTVPLGSNAFPVRGSIPDPGLHLASQFRSFLMARQITCTGKVHTHRTLESISDPSVRILLHTWQSPPLATIAARTNMQSVNTYAENLIKYLGLHYKNEGSFARGAEVITEFWQQKGMPVRGMRIHDGSGLSPFNNLTAAQLVFMLGQAASNPALYEALTSGLPVAGRSGSLERLFTNSPARGILMAKSGFLGNVRAYTGYTKNRKGELIAFAFIVNNYAGTSAVLRDRMVRVMESIGEGG